MESEFGVEITKKGEVYYSEQCSEMARNWPVRKDSLPFCSSFSHVKQSLPLLDPKKVAQARELILKACPPAEKDYGQYRPQMPPANTNRHEILEAQKKNRRVIISSPNDKSGAELKESKRKPPATQPSQNSGPILDIAPPHFTEDIAKDITPLENYIKKEKNAGKILDPHDSKLINICKALGLTDFDLKVMKRLVDQMNGKAPPLGEPVFSTDLFDSKGKLIMLRNEFNLKVTKLLLMGFGADEKRVNQLLYDDNEDYKEGTKTKPPTKQPHGISPIRKSTKEHKTTKDPKNIR